MEKFSLSQILQIFDMDRGRFNEWRNRAYIEPDFTERQGSRTLGYYSYNNILQTAVFKELIENAKMPRTVAAEFLKDIPEWQENGVDTVAFTPIDKDIYILIKNVPCEMYSLGDWYRQQNKSDVA